MAVRIQFRRDLAANWTAANPLMMEGELGLETDTGLFKVGDGVTYWVDLAYSSGPAGPTGATGADGAPGADGATGPAGPGVAAGGTVGQILAKVDSTDYNTVWIDNTTPNVEQYVKNDTGSTIAKGSAVYISGASGDNPLISKAQANYEYSSSKTLGLLNTTLATGDHGYVITEGILTGIDTSAATAGDPIWLSPTTAGGLVFGLAAKPSAPDHMVFVGIVIRVHATNGKVYVKVQNGFELEELHNVAIGTLSNGDVISYNSTTELWENTPNPEAAANAYADATFTPLSDAGIAGGYATLDGSGKIPVTQQSAAAITETSVVASEAAMLALTAQTGDVAVRTDLNKSFILKAEPASTLANWQELLTPTDAVLSVDGNTGAVNLEAKYVQLTDSRLTDQRTPLDSSVTSAKIVAGAVTGTKLALGAVSDSTVSSTAAIAPSKLGSGSANVGDLLMWTGSAWVPTNISGVFPVCSIPFPYLNSGTGSLTVGSTHYMRVMTGGSITKLGFHLSAHSTSGAFTLAVYRNTGTGTSARPGTRVATTGAQTITSAGVYEYNLVEGATIVYPGDWLSISINGGSGFQAPLINNGSYLTTTIRNAVVGIQSSASTPPATASASSANLIYLIWGS